MSFLVTLRRHWLTVLSSLALASFSIMCNVYAIFGDLATAVAYTVVIMALASFSFMCIVYEFFGDLATALAYSVIFIGAGFLQHHVQRLRDFW